jgi:tRNA G18 (ribose-2'-O)-methylase SpoU
MIAQGKKIKKFKQGFFVICDNIRSLQNVGSIFRTSDAFGIDKAYLCGITGAPSEKMARKAALGAEEWIPFEKHWKTWRVIDKLKAEGINVVALEKTKNSRDIAKFKPKFPLALVVGNEVKGVSRSVLKRADIVVHIPMYGKKESLNVAVAYGIAVAKITEHRK